MSSRKSINLKIIFNQMAPFLGAFFFAITREIFVLGCLGEICELIRPEYSSFNRV